MKILLTVLLVVAGLVASNARAEQPPMSAAETGGRTGSGHPKHVPLSGQRGMIEHSFQERLILN
jgi:hypothetical protein